jgi:hypothetical protein
MPTIQSRNFFAETTGLMPMARPTLEAKRDVQIRNPRIEEKKVERWLAVLAKKTT